MSVVASPAAPARIPVVAPHGARSASARRNAPAARLPRSEMMGSKVHGEGALCYIGKAVRPCAIPVC